jgi:hypothetical protein
MERRDFLKNIARGSILTGLGVITGVLLFRDRDAENCDQNFVCESCKRLKSCKLPEAAKYKDLNRAKK